MRRVCLLIPLLLAIPTQAGSRPMTSIAFVDHFNLRKMSQADDADLRRQVAEVKRNMDMAKKYGVNAYILFSRGFEGLINYDFKTDSLGDLSQRVFPSQDEHRRSQARWAKYVSQVLDY